MSDTEPIKDVFMKEKVVELKAIEAKIAEGGGKKAAAKQKDFVYAA